MKKKVYYYTLERFVVVDEQGGGDLKNQVEKTFEITLWSCEKM
jgi:hypothetical protein